MVKKLYSSQTLWDETILIRNKSRTRSVKNCYWPWFAVHCKVVQWTTNWVQNNPHLALTCYKRTLVRRSRLYTSEKWIWINIKTFLLVRYKSNIKAKSIFIVIQFFSFSVSLCYFISFLIYIFIKKIVSSNSLGLCSCTYFKFIWAKEYISWLSARKLNISNYIISALYIF